MTRKLSTLSFFHSNTLFLQSYKRKSHILGKILKANSLRALELEAFLQKRSDLDNIFLAKINYESCRKSIFFL